MEAAVADLLGGKPVERIDVDADPALQARFGRDVPLLFDGALEICRHRLDPERVRARLAARR